MSEDSPQGTLRCLILGHKWTLSPPWTGKELQYDPHCERCAHRPDEIRITGSARQEINHRTP